MVLTAEALVIDHRAAATAAASIHLHYEGAVIETPLAAFTDVIGLEGVAVLAAEQNLVEWYPHEDQPLGDLVAAAGRAIDTGLEVGLVVPAARMGEAHRSFRGTSVTLQPWWHDGETICFGGTEVP